MRFSPYIVKVDASILGVMGEHTKVIPSPDIDLRIGCLLVDYESNISHV